MIGDATTASRPPARMAFAAHVLAQVLVERGAGGRAVATGPDGMEVRSWP